MTQPSHSRSCIIHLGKTFLEKDTCTCMFAAALVTLAETWKQPERSSAEEHGLRTCAIHTHDGILLSHKKEWHNAICSHMEGTRDSHTKWSKSERERQIPYDDTYNCNLICSANEPFHRKENHGLGERNCGCQEGGGGSGTDWKFGVNRCKLLPLEWINNEILRCSTGNYIYGHLWWSMITWEKRTYICMCDWVILLYSRNNRTL